MKRTPILVGASVSLALLAAACGGGKASTTAKAAQTPTSAQDPQAAQGSKPAVNPNAPEANAAGDIPDNQVFVAYTPPSGAFSVKVPEGWARTEASGAVTFTDKLNSVRMEVIAAATAPTETSVTQTELPAIKAASRNFEAGAVKTVTRKAGTALLATYRTDAAPDPVTGKVVHDDVERYEFWRGGKTVVLTLSGPQGADNVDPWRIVTDSFGWR